MKRLLLVLLFGLYVPSTLLAAEITLGELRMERRFGIGFSAAGPLSMLGMEFDFNLTEEISLGAGVGTGLDYSTFMIKAHYLLLGKSVSPYFGAGLARWWTSNKMEGSISPSVLANRFITADEDLSDGFSVWMAYPVAGVQFMHPIGLALFAEVQYLFKLFSLANGTYAGLGMHWYF